MLIDHIVLTVSAGNGGKGSVSFRSNEGKANGGPDGGNGGNGGSVYFIGTSDLTALSQFQHKKNIKADDGVPGKRKNLFGKNAQDLYVKIPFGTEIFLEDGTSIGEIVDESSVILIGKGGKGGRGNNEFKSATNQTPMFAEPGEPGEEKVLRLEMKITAQIGLVGLPNAGKSTMLSLLTNAKPKIGNYPFTTLEPNVGMLDGMMLADIPGLIEGAGTGKGLGATFLRHIEKTRILLHCIDVTSERPYEDYETVRKEFGIYNSELLEKPEIIVLTKIDLLDNAQVDEKQALFTQKGKDVITFSAYDDESLERLSKKVVSSIKSSLQKRN
jgi:GTP-binding protein